MAGTTKIASRQTTVKKAASKKATTKKAASKKATTKKATTKKATTKKATTKKATTKKAASKKAASKKATTKKATTKKATTKKAASKKAASKKAATKKAATKKAATKKAASKKAAAKGSTGYTAPPSGASPALVELARAVLDHALSLPEAWEDHPWGERVAKVKKKVFVFSGWSDGGFGFSVKLPESGLVVLDLPFTSPTGYGLGKAGWVSFRFEGGEDLPPLGLVRDWVTESYRAVAPTTLARLL